MLSKATKLILMQTDRQETLKNEDKCLASTLVVKFEVQKSTCLVAPILGWHDPYDTASPL